MTTPCTSAAPWPLKPLRAAAGDENFFALLHRWVAENRHGSVSTAAFVALADDVCGTDGFSALKVLTPWLSRQPLPPLPRR